MSTQNTSLAGKVAIVTGASRGIGLGIALELANRGAKVALTYTSPSSEELVDGTISTIGNIGNGSAAIKIQADLRQLDAPKKIVSETTAAFGDSIDILVNNAGVAIERALADITPEDFASAFDLNVRGALFLSQAVQPHLRAPGRIINISSIGARLGIPNRTLYLGSKAALEGITRGLAAELGPAGHTVNVVEPGPTESDMIKTVPPQMLAMQKQMTPAEHRLGTPEDIALITAFLAGPESRWITGQCISASGGFSML